MVVGEVTLKSDEGLPPKYTAVAPVNPEPEISTVSPPPAVPLAGVSAPTHTEAAAALESLASGKDGATCPGTRVAPATVDPTTTMPRTLRTAPRNTVNRLHT